MYLCVSEQVYVLLIVKILFFVKWQISKRSCFFPYSAVSSSVVETLRAMCDLTQMFICSVSAMWKVHARYATVISLYLVQLNIMSLLFVCLSLQKSITMSLVRNSLGKHFLLSFCVGSRIIKIE